jgi:hypothetical protein
VTRRLSRFVLSAFVLSLVAFWLATSTQPVQARTVDDPAFQSRACIECTLDALNWSELQTAIVVGMLGGAVAGATAGAEAGVIGAFVGMAAGALGGAAVGSVIGGFVGFIGDLANQALIGGFGISPANATYSARALD